MVVRDGRVLTTDVQTCDGYTVNTGRNGNQRRTIHRTRRELNNGLVYTRAGSCNSVVRSEQRERFAHNHLLLIGSGINAYYVPIQGSSCVNCRLNRNVIAHQNCLSCIGVHTYRAAVAAIGHGLETDSRVTVCAIVNKWQESCCTAYCGADIGCVVSTPPVTCSHHACVAIT